MDKLCGAPPQVRMKCIAAEVAVDDTLAQIYRFLPMTVLETDAQQPIGPIRRRQHLLGLVQTHRDRLLTDNMTACCKRL